MKKVLLPVIIILLLAAVVIGLTAGPGASDPVSNPGTPAASGEGPDGLPTPEVDASEAIPAVTGTPAESGEGPDGLPTPAL